MHQHTVTYSPEDNKLRLYVGRVPRSEYEELRAAGFVSTPKQDCDFVATWTPGREDLARQYLQDGEDIGDEDYSPEERAADRAERFSDYRDKRAGEAGAAADTFESGPSAFGHQNLARAERQARRHDRHRTYAVSQWSKAEYWQARTAAVIAHALHRSDARTRRGRILTLEAEQRKAVASADEYRARYEGWQKVLTLDGKDVPGTPVDTVILEGQPATQRIRPTRDSSPAFRLAYTLVNTSGGLYDYQHPRRDNVNGSLYSLLTDLHDPITPAEAAALWLDGMRSPDDPDCGNARWQRHYELRLEYERAMLANEGGTAADTDMEVGGWIGSRQIHKVNRSPVTGRVVSVTLKIAGDRWGNTSEGYHMRAFNIERLPEGAYRAPTDEERAAFKVATKQRKAAEKASKPKDPPLINPTMEDALKLQAVFNTWDKEPSEVLEMTQAEYSARSKGNYASYETIGITERLRKESRYHSESVNHHGRVTVFKVRKASGGGWNKAPRVIVLTDKPRKPLPWAEVEAVKATMPTADSVYERLGDVQAAIANKWNQTEEQKEALSDAEYIGWAVSGCNSHWTEKGAAMFRQYQAELQPT